MAEKCGRQTDRHTHTQTDRQADRHTDRHTDGADNSFWKGATIRRNLVFLTPPPSLPPHQ